MNIKLHLLLLVLQISKTNIILCLRVRLFKAPILGTKYCANKVDASNIYTIFRTKQFQAR
jgi:hypothetical protein